MAWILLMPCWLFGIQRLPAWILQESKISTYVHQEMSYRLHGDDYPYIGGSRNLERTIQNLFVPHNTHICPSWRLMNWGVVQLAGDLVTVPKILQIMAYLALALVMLCTGHFVAHESRNMTLGYCAAIFVGVSSIQWLSTNWYSAGQTLWAGVTVVMTLITVQEILRRNMNWAWIFVILLCFIAGGFWTIGHASGPTASVYILSQRRRDKYKYAIIPFLATTFTILTCLYLGAHHMEATESLHGRSLSEAINPIRGMVNTCHSILETMMLGTLGITSLTSDVQALFLFLLVVSAWMYWHWIKKLPVNSLELSGGCLLISSYFVEWTFRGYFSWVALKNVVNWYDSIPLIGWSILLCGWIQAALNNLTIHEEVGSAFGRIWMNRGQGIGILCLLTSMMILHQPEVDRQLIENMPPLTQFELDNRMFPIKSLKKLRAVYIWDERVKWQRRHLVKLQEAEAIAQKKGWSYADIHATFGRVLLPLIPDVYDGALLMDIPLKNSESGNPEEIRKTLGRLLTLEPEPTPQWLSRSTEIWPPKGWETKK
ncbi:MAG: hypothetical protein RJA81_818 [Planctomycetota bacterium]